MDKFKKFATTIWKGEYGVFLKTVGETENLFGSMRYNIKHRSAFDGIEGHVAILLANSHYLPHGGEIRVVELFSEMYYLIPFAGIPKQNVTMEIKGRSMRLSEKAHVRKPAGTTELVAELMLPEPMEEEYSRSDYSIRWYHNELVVRVFKYKNRVMKVVADFDGKKDVIEEDVVDFFDGEN
ncbi:hypothetical protein HanHA300_Chr08g0275681 [Helianthus annuus]|uniref:uncharacterized protein LOC110871034 n=1 Tax=Helianthus annuus TaxID=4232 RepID=UPI000B8F9CD6|nr:uncharacterized protein LOC110871034 [Helianthus annuus]XP_021975718.1 uncharacterized protein LOC110871034 [Helianthus annuus]KAJ0538499.1 hypothetical protein HanHA300_Chr08g0275681 [Helianthus annuus]KAJ0553127.1 hypothetical protein HanHA89_Chr08g0292981 [Helianthus annuus]